MLARSVRSGLAETYHDGAVLVLDSKGATLFSDGDVDRVFFFRSSIKPFQAQVAIEAGADLNDEQLALACSSHGGQPVHLAIVWTILSSAGLSESDLRCPAEWPLSPSARNRLRAEGVRRPARLTHNCSGKHAAALAACLAAGWPLDTYMESDHPYQQAVLELVGTVAGAEVTPAGVDGCGFPTLRGSVRSLASAFLALATSDRFERIRDVMHRMPALTADGSFPETAVATWLPAIAKVGAMGCAGVAAPFLGAAAGKSWDASKPALWVGMIEAMRRAGWIGRAASDGLAPHARPAVYGGGRVVGALEPAL